MSSYLLDTHILLWWLTAPSRLGATTAAILDDRRNALRVSAAVLWELAIKKAIGRIEMPGDLLNLLDDQDIRVLPIEAQHALAVADLPLLHGDPFDRIQVAQARIERLVIITRDPMIPRYDVECRTA